MNRLLKSALIELRGEGVDLDPIADLEHILTLDKLSARVLRPDPSRVSEAFYQPILSIGGVSLRRLSLGAQRFVSEVVLEWFRKDVLQQDLAYIYCMHLSKTPADLWALQDDQVEFTKAMKAWSRSISIPLDSLKKAVRKFLDVASDDQEQSVAVSVTAARGRQALSLLEKVRPMPPDYKLSVTAALEAMEIEENEGDGGYGPMIATLVSEYGHNGEYWLWRASQAEIELLLKARNEKMEAEIRAVKGSQDDRMQRAHYAFRSYMDTIIKIKKGSKS